MGCLASKEGIILYKKFPYLDIIIGPRSLINYIKIFHLFFKKNKNIINVAISDNHIYNNLINNNRILSSFVPIMDGCNKYCTFCIVPYTRGLEIYRNIKNCIEEITYLSKNNIIEITLLGQNVNAFHSKLYNNVYTFPFLVKKIFNIKMIKRIKFITSHPIEVCNNLINIYKKYNKLSNNFHLPIQSGANKILNLMNRGYNVTEYIKKIYKLKILRPNISISTDIIIGFPKETYNDFINTLNIIQKINFDNLFVFIYSKRPGTLSEKLYPKIPLFIKKKRIMILNNIIKKTKIVIDIKIIGTVHNILVIGIYNLKYTNILYGYSENNKIIFFRGDIGYIGNICKVYISNISNFKIFGIIIRNFLFLKKKFISKC